MINHCKKSKPNNNTNNNNNLNSIPAHSTTAIDGITEATDNTILRECVRTVLTNYIDDLEGHHVDDLYQLVLSEVEVPLLETILNHTRGNQSKAAQMLGINRGTLRKKIKQYDIKQHQP